MVFIEALNTAKAVLGWNVGAQILANTLFFTKGSSWSDANLASLAGSLVDWVRDNFLDYLSNEASLISVEASDQASDSGSVVVIPVTSSNVGTVASAALPNNAAAVVTFRTAQRGRSYRGRNYVAGLPLTVLDDPVTLASGTLTTLISIYGNLGAVEVATGSTHVVCSRYAEKAARSSAVMTPITSYTCDDYVDSQRRRLGGRGT